MLNVFSKKGLDFEFGWAWAFSAYIDVAESCRANSILRQLSTAAAIKEKDSDPKIPSSLNSMLGDLYFSACQSLWKLGVSFSLIPSDTFFVFGPDPHEVAPQYSVGNESLAEKYDPYFPLVPTRESLSNFLSMPANSSNLSLATVASFSPPSAADIVEFSQAGSDSPLKPTKHRRQPSIIESVNLSDETISAISLSDKTKRARQSKTPARTAPRSGLTHRRQRSADGALNLSSKLAAAAFISEGNTPPAFNENVTSTVPEVLSSTVETSLETPNGLVFSQSHDSPQRVSTSPILPRSPLASPAPPAILPDPAENESAPNETTKAVSHDMVEPQEGGNVQKTAASPIPSQTREKSPHPPSLRSTHPSLSTALISPVGFDRVCTLVSPRTDRFDSALIRFSLAL
jgi:hypothetical protein